MKKSYRAGTEHIIALCHIIDDFEEFEKRLIPIISSKYNKDFALQLWDISKGKSKLGARKAKKFYSENKSIIDTINKYSNITGFINYNYRCYGTQKGDIQFFYEYILKHKEELKQILAVLGKLSELGFREFEFNEKLDFTKETYEADSTFESNFCITYVANAQVILNYVDYINYKTSNSNYKMELYVSDDKFSIRDIKLNSLLFDPTSLPDVLDKENTFDHFLKLKNEQKEQSATTRNSVDLGISILDLERQFSFTNNIISKLNGVKNKDQLLEILLSIKEDVEKLKTLSSQYDSSILEENPLLTPEVLKKEKTLYLKRRYWKNLDID